MTQAEKISQMQALDAPWEGKAILLVDLDAFFASVEQLDHPEWRGKPVIVGGPSSERGVVSTCSYEARVYGVRSAMPSSLAERLCPDAIWTSGHYARYKELSNKVMAILGDETPYMQQVSIDEAFIDVTPSRVNKEHPVDIARRIQSRVAELGISCSIGVSTCKTVSKIASEQGKPRGLTVVYPGQEETFLKPLAIKEMSGIGPSSAAELNKFGIKTLGDLAVAEESVLKKVFGKNASLFRLRAQGKEVSLVEERGEAKSISNELSFPVDLTQQKEVEDTLFLLAEKVGSRARKAQMAGCTVGVKIRYANRKIRSAQRHVDTPLDNELLLYPLCLELLATLWTEGTPVRLLGVSLTSLTSTAAREEGQPAPEEPAEPVQLSLFGDEEETDEEAAARQRHAEKLQSLISATDQVKTRFGKDSLGFGRTFGNKNAHRNDGR